MATLDNSNIANGNTVETTDILQLYTALGTGTPGSITGLVITGSLKGNVDGNASTATSATSATSATTAITANTASYVTTVSNQEYDAGGVAPGNFKFIAGTVNMSSGAATSSTFTILGGKQLGVDAFITANYTNTPPAGANNAVVIDAITGGQIVFSNNQPGSPASATIVFTGFVIVP